MNDLVAQLTQDFPHIKLQAGSAFYWSPRAKTVFYNAEVQDAFATLSLLHELGHGILEHKTFGTDFELLLLEVDAWREARKLAKKYKIKIDYDHIEDSLDTYRDWLHERSHCPTCGVRTLQSDQHTYHCYNCEEEWHVSRSRFCRAYRRLSQQKTA